MTPDEQARTVQLVVSESEDSYSQAKILVLLCLVSSLEGADGALLPSTVLALEENLGITMKSVGTLALVQALCQALIAPFWGILASRAIMDRKSIVILGCVLQGLVTMLLAGATSFSTMLPLRALNGLLIASLRPISAGIVADVFSPENQGKAFGAIMMSASLGGAISGLICTPLSRQIVFGVMGWQIAFVAIGAFCVLLGPLLMMLLVVPKVKPSASSSVKQELGTLIHLLKMPTFAALVMQGCFGIIPWQAGNFRTAFYQVYGINDTTAALVGSVGGFAGSAGLVLGGWVGDALARCNKIHGRIWTAEISVLSGIPVAFFTFMVFPSSDMAFQYYLVLSMVLGLMATWCGTGVNPPILCSIASEDQRCLVMAWLTALEGAVGASGNFWVGFLAEQVFGYDVNADVGPENAASLGQAMFWVSAVPWAICLGFYVTLHFAYPRDLARLEAAKQQVSEQELRDKIYDLSPKACDLTQEVGAPKELPEPEQEISPDSSRVPSKA